MTRKEAKELLPIIQAFAEGKTIQWKNNNRSLWNEASEENAKLSFNTFAYSYRIKPEPKYRPFKTQEECWHEMLKHLSLGWVKTNNSRRLISSVTDTLIWFNDRVYYTFEQAFGTYKFIDGTPFGIKEE